MFDVLSTDVASVVVVVDVGGSRFKFSVVGTTLILGDDRLTGSGFTSGTVILNASELDSQTIL